MSRCRGCFDPLPADRELLCFRCTTDPKVRKRWGQRKNVQSTTAAMTEEELDAFIAEGLANPPPWWDKETEKMRGRAPKPEDED